jgi:signal transduction histidine kinase
VAGLFFAARTHEGAVRHKGRATASRPGYISFTHAMNQHPNFFEGLNVKRVLWVTIICMVATGTVIRFVTNTYLDLLVTALCVGYTSMVLFTVAGNVRLPRVPPEAMQVLAVIVGSVLGTILAVVVKGRDMSGMFSERLVGLAISMGLGIGFGCVVVAGAILRAKHARDQARIAKAEAERNQLEKNILEARLALMQAQVEPHFLFNTLANVQHLVETDTAAASRMLESLIQYLRAALPQMREGTTTLGRELDMARAFLDIHRVRMGSRLDYRIEVPETLKARAFPPMMLISLVENAIKHGVDPCCECGSITIRAADDGERLKVSVADTGEGVTPKKGGGVGLTNIRERLKALYGSRATLVLEENAPRGVVASIEVPA